MPLPDSGLTRRRRIRPLLVIAALVVPAVAGLVVGAMIWRAEPPAEADDRSAAPTTTITRETLIDFVTASGELAFGPRLPVESRLTGTITALPPVGTIVDRGQVLFRIDDKPVVLLIGTLPAYRELSAGRAAPAATEAAGAAAAAEVPPATGPDVKQFEENLKALGYSGLTVDDRYTGQTATVVRRWQKDLGLEQTGVVELGRVVYTPGPIRVAEHKLTAGAVATGPVLTYTGAVRLVIAEIKETDQELAKPQTAVRVTLPNGKDLAGTVVSAGPAPDAQPVVGQERTLEVVVTLTDPAAVDGPDSGPARVRFVAQERKDVLVVPIGALLALAEGGYGLEIIEGASSRVVAVTAGLFANGKVEVSGPDVREGTTVGTAR